MEPLDVSGEEQRPSGLPRLARATALLGILLTVAGHLVFGPAVVVAAYLGGMRKSVRRKVVADGVVFLVLVLAFAVSDVASAQSKRHRAHRDLDELSAQVLAFRATQGGYPSDLSELGWRLYEVFGEGTARDPWGRSYEYTPPEKPGEPAVLRSAGPDPSLTEDDAVKDF
jgi:hypothetical protein